MSLAYGHSTRCQLPAHSAHDWRRETESKRHDWCTWRTLNMLLSREDLASHQILALGDSSNPRGMASCRNTLTGAKRIPEFVELKISISENRKTDAEGEPLRVLGCAELFERYLPRDVFFMGHVLRVNRGRWSQIYLVHCKSSLSNVSPFSLPNMSPVSLPNIYSIRGTAIRCVRDACDGLR